ncbi:hypothetical protein AB2B38_000695 [Balneola sp. MJW-20]|uniref:hypothetical protein n=1 Tax=Gracilimonas aurantiaca TaxID=3234185 RepID=UPI0034654ED6
MDIQNKLQQLHKKVTSNYWLKLFTSLSRLLLAAGFIIPGMKKVLNVHFAPGVGPGPIREFFDAFFYATEYYIFVGLIQVLAGVLLLFPSTVALGTFIFLPVILNIFVLTLSLNFTGTWLIAGLMLTAAVYLLFWEFDRWQSLIPGFKGQVSIVPDKNLGFFTTILFGGLTGLTGLGILFTGMAIYQSTNRFLVPLLILTISGLGAFLFIKKHREFYLGDG